MHVRSPGRVGSALAAAVAVVALTFGAAGSARADVITYDFTVTATSGPLAGDTGTGTFSYDTATLTVDPGDPNEQFATVSSFNFNFLGQNYTLADNINPLFAAEFENDTPAGFQLAGFDTPIPGNDGSYVAFFKNIPGAVFTIGDDETGFLYGTFFGGPVGGGDVTFALAAPVPEPSTLALGLMSGAAGLIGWVVRRRRRATA